MTRSAICVCLAVATLPSAGEAQRARTRRPVWAPPRVHVGGGLAVAQAVGEFENYVDAGIGLGGSFLFHPAANRAFALRLDAMFLVYGSETRRRPLSPTVPFVTVDVTTRNNIVTLGVGPEFSLGSGALRPYVNGLVGFSYFATVSSVRGASNIESFASSTNFDDFTFASQSGAGLRIALGRGRSPVSLDLSARYVNNGRVSYLREGSISVGPDDSLQFTPIESQTNLVVYQLGVSIGVRGDPHRGPGR